MFNLLDAEFSVAEAAFVTDMPERAIQSEIDAQIVPARSGDGQRILSGVDVVYLDAVRDVRVDMSPKLRHEIFVSFSAALMANVSIAGVASLQFDLAFLITRIGMKVAELRRVKHERIESKPEILAGEPVIKGTRVPARLIAGLVKQGTSRKEIEEDYDLSSDQIEAAVVFDRITPKRGRPALRKLNVKQHVPSAR